MVIESGLRSTEFYSCKDSIFMAVHANIFTEFRVIKLRNPKFLVVSIGNVGKSGKRQAVKVGRNAKNYGFLCLTI